MSQSSVWVFDIIVDNFIEEFGGIKSKSIESGHIDVENGARHVLMFESDGWIYAIKYVRASTSHGPILDPPSTWWMHSEDFELADSTQIDKLYNYIKKNLGLP